MSTFNTLADLLAGSSSPGPTPVSRGYAETDSSDGEASIYLGEMEQVWETAVQPVWQVDENGEAVTDEDGEPLPVLDEDGNQIEALQPVLDEFGVPVPVLDAGGNPVFEKVQLVDADGEPVLVYDGDGNPVAQTDPETGEPVYLEDEDGNPLPVLDEAGEQAYAYAEDGTPEPLYQVAPVLETQTVTLPVVGAVKAGETPLVSMGHGGAAAIAGAGWGDSIEESIGDAAAVASEAAAVAAATNQHFWTDSAGVHVTEEEHDATTGHNILINSVGILLRRAAANLVSITRSAIAFYDGADNAPANEVAQFGVNGARIGKERAPHVEVTTDEVAFYDGEGTLTSNVITRMGVDGARIGRVSDTNVSISGDGFTIDNGPDRWLDVSGEPIGGIAKASDGEREYELLTLDYTLEGVYYPGAMRPYRVYGVFDGSDLRRSVMEAYEAGTLDEHLHITSTPSDIEIYAVAPVGEPEPEMWIVTDGQIGDQLMSLADAELFPGWYMADGLPAWDAGKHRPALAHGLWDEYGIDGTERPSSFGRQFILESPNAFDESFEDRARTYLGAFGYNTVVIASAYRKRTGEIDALVPLKQNGVQVSVEGHRHEASDIDGLVQVKAGNHLSMRADSTLDVETLTAQQVANLLTDD